ncbi:alpha/beta hydrolase [Shimia abyssi]|uniref:Alpha/beta hydrolase family protein n=1 Tax=Shimia abyssi TaxID=1662395 RepID=A0A2P8FAA8_9RHOB|nr:alpha/beta hydrolase [Shimia abyssi]PSL18659.1 alpha/beta hydrolase family protein [Shimia abyssi]
MDFDDAFANAAHIENGDAYPAKWAQQAKQFREISTSQIGVPYGEGDRHKFDLFLPRDTPKGLFVFVHGGYWLRFDRSSWSHLAKGAVERGWAVAMPSYDLAPIVRIAEITKQMAQAVSVAAKMVDGPIMLAGHSAGGHLVARTICPGVLPDTAAARITRVVPISPVSDLRPLMKTSMNADLRLDDAECTAESPVLQTPLPSVQVTVWVGAQERPVFLDQASQLAKAWNCDCMITGGKHHFDVIDVLHDPDSDLSRMLFSA